MTIANTVGDGRQRESIWGISVQNEMMSRRYVFILIALFTVVAMLFLVDWGIAPSVNLPSNAPLSHEAYVWQRAWTPAVRQAIQARNHDFADMVVLGAEVSFVSGQPRVTRTEVDYAMLAQGKQPVGLALRIGSYAGTFAANGNPADTIVSSAKDMVQQARQAGCDIRELQIDFDCPESKLDGYAVWVEAIDKAIAPLPVVVTALPSWLDRQSMKTLLAKSAGFILQVHSFRRPSGPNDMAALCDPVAAQQAVQKAGRLGKAFRVALPTYGYRVAFNSDGKYLGAWAEGPAPAWPVGAAVGTLRAEPAAIASLVAQWTKAHPSNMQGIIWYRLPTDDDTMNWHWRTLAAVMAGNAPAPALAAEIRKTEDGVADVTLVNSGTEDADTDVVVTVRWDGGDIVAADALPGFDKIDPTSRRKELRFTGRVHLRPQQQASLGWIRLSDNREVHAHVETGKAVK